MKVPVKITPDNLLDTIVEIRYNSNVSHELIPGILSKVLPDDFIYLNPTNVTPNGLSIDITNPETKLIFGIDSPNVFSNKEVKIQIRRENSLVFNCVGNYIGWIKYFTIMEKILKLISKEDIFHSYNRIGIRYISKFDNVSIFDKLKGSFKLDVPNKSLNNTTFRTEYFLDDKRIIINLSNNVQRKDEIYSLIDIDVLVNLKSSNFNELLEKIEIAHKDQKETFFGILNDDFLKSLNPKYN